MIGENQKPWRKVLIIGQLAVILVVVPLLPLLITGRWSWWEAWVYAGITFFGFVISRALAARAHPDLLAERAKMADHPDAADWDRVLAPLVALGGGLIPLVAGLDAALGWSGAFPLGWKMAALVVILIGYLLGSWALIANRYFSGLVRIQHDRGHQVVSRGPYRWIRHPGYAGAILSYLGAPVLLDSLWAFVPAGLLVVGLVIRTALEDQTLQAELEGYRGYTERVRDRLVPGVW
jgi:protein-S-isoprenylcysteine O-methyltransferase Ste14